MTFRRSAPSALIAVVIIVIAALTTLSARLFGNLTDAIEKDQFALMQAIFDTAVHDAEGKALARAEMVASLPVARQALAAQDRQALLDNFAALFEVQKERHGVDQMQFHIPPATSFLRLQAPSLFGDDLSRFRPMVVAVNRDKVSAKGLAIARTGPAVFGVAPVFGLDGKHAGSVEFGIDFGSVLVNLKRAYDIEFSLFMDEKQLRDFASGMNPAVFSDQNRVGRFIRLEATNEAVMQGLALDTDISGVVTPVTYTRDAEGIPHGVLLLPLRNAAGELLGVVAAARDFSGSRAAAGRSLVWQICLAVFAVVILAGAIIFVIRGFLLRPLEIVSERFAALTARKPAEPITETRGFPAELDSYVAMHNRLADQRMRSGSA